ncbi:unnamed protein product [Parnassius apollo]|uniref:(apollo) hypothetical protein n=1 Tax=Parnassius apollo TaxID=110799 RepID=A0A8S3W9X0_PARAO|nr:unnamed protein product [Parnassius apollo]
MTAASNVQTERVIQEVRLRPCLWNLRDNSYKNKDAKLKAWKDVCEAVCPNFGDSSGEEKKQIDLPKCCFNVIAKLAKYFTYYHDPGLAINRRNISDTCAGFSKTVAEKKKRCMTDFESQLLKILEKNDTSTTNFASSTALKDDDCSFFNSLAPIINDFDNYKKLLFRTRILELAMEIRGPAMNSPSTSASTATNDLPHLSGSDVDESLESWQHGDYTAL